MSLTQPVEASSESLPAVKPARSPLTVRSLFIDHTNDTLIQFIRYVVTGVGALGVDVGTLYGLTRFAGVHYLVSAAAAFTLGLLVNYVVSSAWVFGHRVVQNRLLEFGIFAGIGLVGLGFNELGLWLLTSVLGIYYLWAKVATAGVVFIWNFGARKLALFR